MQLKNPVGKNSFCKSVKKIYFTGYSLGAGGDRTGKGLLQGKEQICMCVGGLFWVEFLRWVFFCFHKKLHKGSHQHCIAMFTGAYKTYKPSLCF